MPVPQLNPYGLQEGQQCDTIRIQHLPTGREPEEVVVSLPVDAYPTMQAAATEAYLLAKQEGHLTAGLMAFCQFSCRDDAADAWVIFDPADY